MERVGRCSYLARMACLEKRRGLATVTTRLEESMRCAEAQVGMEKGPLADLIMPTTRRKTRRINSPRMPLMLVVLLVGSQQEFVATQWLLSRWGLLSGYTS